MKYDLLINQIKNKENVVKISKNQKKTCELFLKSIDEGSIVLNDRDVCLCSSENSVLIAPHDRHNLPFKAYLCEKCGLIYTTPYISSASMEYYYKNFYNGIHFNIKPKDHKVIYKKGQGEKIFNFLNQKLATKDIKILDFGCGQGSVIKEFMASAMKEKYTVRGVGLEFNEDYVASSDKEDFDLEIRQGGVDSILKEDGCFDVVILSHVFEHLTEPNEFLTKLKKIVHRDSLIYIEVPGVCDLKQSSVYNSNFIQYCTAAHILNYNLVSLTNILNVNGFKLIWGNEIVESVFILGDQSVSVHNNAKIIQSYLDDLLLNETFYQSLNTVRLKERLSICELERKVEQISKELHYLIITLRLIRKTICYLLKKAQIDKVVKRIVRIVLQIRQYIK